MKIYSIYDKEFKSYGRVVSGYDLKELLEVLDRVAILTDGVEYVPEQKELQELPVKDAIQNHLYGGMPVELGWCAGRNTMLNCLEYHRDSEINCGTGDFILLLGKREEIEEDGFFDTKNVKAFYVPAGVLVETFATTLHYAPCSTKKGEGFKVLVVLPQGTNTDLCLETPIDPEDKLLFARNKWLLAHPDSDEAKDGATIAIKGDNIDISDDIS